jgi:hypothetical protein
MQRIKKTAQGAWNRFKNSKFALRGAMALTAITISAVDMMATNKGSAGFTKATTEISGYQTPVSNLMKAIAAVIVLVGLSMSISRCKTAIRT